MNENEIRVLDSLFKSEKTVKALTTELKYPVLISVLAYVIFGWGMTEKLINYLTTNQVIVILIKFILFIVILYIYMKNG